MPAARRSCQSLSQSFIRMRDAIREKMGLAAQNEACG